VNGVSSLRIMGPRGSSAAQTRRMSRVQAGGVMTGKGGQLATGGAICVMTDDTFRAELVAVEYPAL
jgi:hypothetical protein